MQKKEKRSPKSKPWKTETFKAEVRKQDKAKTEGTATEANMSVLQGLRVMSEWKKNSWLDFPLLFLAFFLIVWKQSLPLYFQQDDEKGKSRCVNMPQSFISDLWQALISLLVEGFLSKCNSVTS